MMRQIRNTSICITTGYDEYAAPRDHSGSRRPRQPSIGRHRAGVELLAVNEGIELVTSPTMWLRRLTATTTAGAMMVLAAPVVLETTTRADRHPTADSTTDRATGSTDRATDRATDLASDLTLVAGGSRSRRRIVHYTVKPGDTVTGLAVRFHAWTAELLKINHLGTGSVIYVGQRLLIPVVRKQDRANPPKKHPRPAHPKSQSSPWPRYEPSRAEVRQVIINTANRHDLNPNLALAVAWQESGWRMHVISSAHAIGTMQVLPGTGRWMSDMVGRPLNLYRVRDNVTAGVVLLKWLRSQARPRRAIAGYYQGLAGVKKYGMYASTKQYVANVVALRKRIGGGWNPS